MNPPELFMPVNELAVRCSATVTVTKESIHCRTGWFRDGRSGHFRVFSARTVRTVDRNRAEPITVFTRGEESRWPPEPP